MNGLNFTQTIDYWRLLVGILNAIQLKDENKQIGFEIIQRFKGARIGTFCK